MHSRQALLMPRSKRHVISRKTLYNRYGGRCAYCGVALPRHGWHRDHVEPIVRFRGVRYTFSGRGGCKYPENHRADNIVACCAACNKDKGSLDLETWRGTLRWLGWQRGIVFYFERYKCDDS